MRCVVFGSFLCAVLLPPDYSICLLIKKHLGKKIEDVAQIDRGYLEWLLAQKLASDQIDEDWIYTLKHHLEK